jgi:hypothetical protein
MRERAQEDSHLIVGLVPMNQVFVFTVVSAFFCYVLVCRWTTWYNYVRVVLRAWIVMPAVCLAPYVHTLSL